jgi:hypothetical protein
MTVEDSYVLLPRCSGNEHLASADCPVPMLGRMHNVALATDLLSHQRYTPSILLTVNSTTLYPLMIKGHEHAHRRRFDFRFFSLTVVDLIIAALICMCVCLSVPLVLCTISARSVSFLFYSAKSHFRNDILLAGIRSFVHLFIYFVLSLSSNST